MLENCRSGKTNAYFTYVNYVSVAPICHSFRGQCFHSNDTPTYLSPGASVQSQQIDICTFLQYFEV